MFRSQCERSVLAVKLGKTKQLVATKLAV